MFLQIITTSETQTKASLKVKQPLSSSKAPVDCCLFINDAFTFHLSSETSFRQNGNLNKIGTLRLLIEKGLFSLSEIALREGHE